MRERESEAVEDAVLELVDVAVPVGETVGVPLVESVDVDDPVPELLGVTDALAPGEARVRNLLDAEDIAASLRAIQAFGCQVQRSGDATIVRSPARLREPTDVIDCGNSGTTMRLCAGIAASIPGLTVLTGVDYWNDVAYAKNPTCANQSVEIAYASSVNPYAGVQVHIPF